MHKFRRLRRHWIPPFPPQGPSGKMDSALISKSRNLSSLRWRSWAQLGSRFAAGPLGSPSLPLLLEQGALLELEEEEGGGVITSRCSSCWNGSLLRNTAGVCAHRSAYAAGSPCACLCLPSNKGDFRMLHQTNDPLPTATPRHAPPRHTTPRHALCARATGLSSLASHCGGGVVNHVTPSKRHRQHSGALRALH